MLKKTHILSVIYALLSLSLLYVIVLSKEVEQIPIKILYTIVLGLIYILNVPKNKRNFTYFMVLLFFNLGDIFYSYPTRFFVFSFFAYLAIYVVLTLKIYKNLQNKDGFRIFTFASPFIFTYGLIFSLLKNLSTLWMIVVLFSSFIVCVNASVIVLNYAGKRNKRNLLLFVGIFLFQMVNFLAVVHYFNNQRELYYFIANALSLVAQYLICLAFISVEGNRNKIE